MHNELGLRKIQDVVDANTLNFYNHCKNLPEARIVTLVLLEQDWAVTSKRDTVSDMERRRWMAERGQPPPSPLEMLIYISQQANNEWMNNPDHYQPVKFTRKLAPFLTKVFLAGKAIGVTHRMDNRQSVKVLAKQKRLAEFKELVLSSARLRPLEDRQRSPSLQTQGLQKLR